MVYGNNVHDIMSVYMCTMHVQMLGLSNGDQLPLSNNVKLLFETDDISEASPSIIARAVSLTFYTSVHTAACYRLAFIDRHIIPRCY